MLKNIGLWLPSYIKQLCSKKCLENGSRSKIYVLFTICDHYEPFWNKVDHTTAYKRVKRWADCYQTIADKHTDSMGNHPQHCFFYPEEEYKKDLLDMVGEICHNGFGETEIHLHHDNDTADNLRKTLLNFKKVLAEEHGLLSKDINTGEVKYGFIHGNWALDNSRPDGKWCGVNNEISILQETGCYADFTMPSAPSDTQTAQVNSIYYAKDDPNKPKSHNKGTLAKVGIKNEEDFLCIQGPLCLNFKSRKFGLLPRIENGRLAHNTSVSKERIDLWIRQHIHVQGRANILFVKLYSHGTQEKDMNFFFEQGVLNTLFTNLEEFCEERQFQLRYISARQMYNVIKGIEETKPSSPEDLFNFKLQLNH